MGNSYFKLYQYFTLLLFLLEKINATLVSIRHPTKHFIKHYVHITLHYNTYINYRNIIYKNKHNHKPECSKAVHLAILTLSLVMITAVQVFVGNNVISKTAKKTVVKIFQEIESRRRQHNNQKTNKNVATNPSSRPFLNVPVYIRPSGHLTTPLEHIHSQSSSSKF